MNMAQALPTGYFVRYIEPVGDHDLYGKPAFKLALQEANSRVIFSTASSIRENTSTAPRH